MTRITTPIQNLLFGFVALIIVGTTLLLLPVSAAEHQQISLIDALFTATSAISTTGLVTIDTGTSYSVFGQSIILLLFQIGGLGYMIFITLIALGIGSGFTISGRLLLTESIARPTNMQIRKFIKAVIFFTLFFEALGAAALCVVFMQSMSFSAAAYSALFHSISAFCTAGFSLYADSFTAYAGSVTVNSVIAVITVAGGIGFFVLYDVANIIRRILRQQLPVTLSDHTKLVLVVSAGVMISGSIALFFIEGSSNRSIPVGERLLTATFQALSASTTTGFNSVDIGALHSLSLVYIVILMFVGASPGGTGGGIKSTSFGIILLFIRSVLTNRDEVSAFHRTIAASSVKKALGIGLLGSLYLALLVMALSVTEPFSLRQIVFEAVSAFGTVGLSTGITPQLSVAGKIFIIITMFIGRVGPLAIGYSLVGRFDTKKYSYPTGNVIVG